jgi:amino acid adenylation domain-containing protein
MTSAELVSHLRSRDIRVWSENGQLRINGPKGSLTPDLRAMLAAQKDELLSFLMEAGRIDREPMPPPMSRVSRTDPLPVSFAQQRLWFIDRLEPGSPLYNISINVRLAGSLDAAALAATLNEIVRRHETLRTTLPDSEGQPVVNIAGHLEIPLPVIDLRSIPESQREDEIRRLSDREAREPFDLAHGPLLRATLIKATEQDHVLLLTMHHIVSDGWSMSVLFRELALLYSAFSMGHPSPLDELQIQYADFAKWQHQWLSGAVLERLSGYWQRQLRNLPVLELHTDRPRPAVQSYRGAEYDFTIRQEWTGALLELSKGENATLYMTLLTAFLVLLHRYTGSDDIVVGSPIAARNHVEIEGLIGFFVNTIALRADLSGNPTFRQALARVRESALGAYAHQELPFEKLIEKLQPERNLSHHPLFQVMFVLQNAPAEPPHLAGLTVTPLRQENSTAKIDLMLTLRETANGLQGSLQYSTDLFDASTMERMAGHYQCLLESAIADPGRSIGDLTILTAAEQKLLLMEWNSTAVAYPHDKCIHELFEAQVERTPNTVAVAFGSRQLTYRELNARANQLSHYLGARGVGPEVPVGICVERSLEMIIGILGILKAGGAYVPLDPAYPPDRLAFILENTGARLVLTQESLAPRLSGTAEMPVSYLQLDAQWPEISLESERNPDGLIDSRTLAYIMYTSGSTGKPKGVRIEHRSVVRLVMGSTFVKFGPSEVFLQFAPLSFDASTFEIWGCLLHGSKLVVFPPHVPTLEELGEFIATHYVSTLWLTAALFAEMVECQLVHLQNVRQLLAGGDVLPVPQVNQVLASRGKGVNPANSYRLVNGYGPTENTTFTCCHIMDSSDSIPLSSNFLSANSSVPIGRPTANTRVYILDERLQPVPIGVPGELFASGDGLARDYHRDPQLTAEKFIPDPFNNTAGARMYRTGDRARYLPDGSIEFLGRLDNQVKIRGFRIEPAEIEAILTRHSGVARAVVLAVAGREGLADRSLVAYIVAVADSKPTTGALRSHLKMSLPDYMVPAAFVFLDAMPVTANGKIDRQALPVPEQSLVVSERTFVAPRNHLERQLAEIWKSVLPVRTIGIRDSFFDLGGHSLLAVRVTSKIEKTFGKRLPLSSFFQEPTVEHLGKLLREEIPPSIWKSLIPIQTQGSRRPFFWVHGERSNSVLPRYLHPDQPLYGFGHQSEDGCAARHKDVEDIAAHYLGEIRTIQPHGPYFLGGYCFGGLVAFEMAHQLTALQEPVAVVALLAPSSPISGKLSRRAQRQERMSVARKTWSSELGRHLQNLERLTPREKRTYIQARAGDKISGLFRPVVGPLKRKVQQSACRVILDLGYTVPPGLRNPYILDVYRQAMRRYQAKSYRGSVALFLPDSQSDHSRHAWKELSAPDTSIIEFPGGHTDILLEPHLQGWARQLSAILEEAQSKSNT